MGAVMAELGRWGAAVPNIGTGNTAQDLLLFGLGGPLVGGAARGAAKGLGGGDEIDAPEAEPPPAALDAEAMEAARLRRKELDMRGGFKALTFTGPQGPFDSGSL